MNLLRFTPKLAASMLVVTGLLASHAHAQFPGGSQSQLRPPSGGKIMPQVSAVPPANNTSLAAQVNTPKVHTPVKVELPLTEFGTPVVRTEVQKQITLRKVYDNDPANTGKTTELPSIRLSGSQSADFSATPPNCHLGMESGKMVVQGLPMTTPPAYVFTCTSTVTFRPSAEGARSALLEALFADGDRFSAVLKGTGRSPTVSLSEHAAPKGAVARVRQ